MSLRDEILAAPDLKRVPVEVPEWPVKKGSLFLQELCVAEAEALREMLDEPDKRRLFRVELLIRTLVDSEGKQVFTKTDADALAKKSANVMIRLTDRAMQELSLAPEAIKEAEKNSSSTLRE